MPKYIVGIYPVVKRRIVEVEAKDYKGAVKEALQILDEIQTKIEGLGWHLELDFVIRDDGPGVFDGGWRS